MANGDPPQDPWASVDSVFGIEGGEQEAGDWSSVDSVFGIGEGEEPEDDQPTETPPDLSSGGLLGGLGVAETQEQIGQEPGADLQWLKDPRSVLEVIQEPGRQLTDVALETGVGLADLASKAGLATGVGLTGDLSGEEAEEIRRQGVEQMEEGARAVTEEGLPFREPETEAGQAMETPSMIAAEVAPYLVAGGLGNLGKAGDAVSFGSRVLQGSRTFGPIDFAIASSSPERSGAQAVADLAAGEDHPFSQALREHDVLRGVAEMAGGTALDVPAEFARSTYRTIRGVGEAVERGTEEGVEAGARASVGREAAERGATEEVMSSAPAATGRETSRLAGPDEGAEREAAERAQADDLAPGERRVGGVRYKATVDDAHGQEQFGRIVARDEETGEIIGEAPFSDLAGEDVLIRMMEVNPEYRREGVAREMLRTVKENFPDADIDLGYSVSDEGEAFRRAAEEEGLATPRQTLQGPKPSDVPEGRQLASWIDDEGEFQYRLFDDEEAAHEWARENVGPGYSLHPTDEWTVNPLGKPVQRSEVDDQLRAARDATVDEMGEETAGAGAEARGGRGLLEGAEGVEPGDVIGPRGERASDKTFALPVEEIERRPQQMQYKTEGIGSEGVSSKMKNVEVWDDDAAGTIAVWRDPESEEWVVVDGHHRHELAERLNAEGNATAPDQIDVAEIKAGSAEEARAVGALKNIREGRGTVLDAAKYFRDTGIDREGLRAKGVPLTEHTVEQGLAISNLPDAMFQSFRRKELPVQRAALIGGSGLSEPQMLDLWKQIDSDMRNDEVKQLIDFARTSETGTEKQETLFGTEEIGASNLREKAEVSAYIDRQLGKQARTFKYTSKQERADLLEGAGVAKGIETERAEELGTSAEQVREVFNKLKSRAGSDVSDLLNEAANRIKRGDDATEVKRQTLQRVEQELRSFIEGGERAGDRAGGEAGEAGTRAAGESGEPESAGGLRGADVEDDPSLLELGNEAPSPSEGGFANLGQGDLFGRSASPAEGGDQFGMGLRGGEESAERQGASAARRQARETVDRLEQTVREGDPSLDELKEYRDALRMLTEGEGRTLELQRIERRIENMETGRGELRGPEGQRDLGVEVRPLPEVGDEGPGAAEAGFARLTREGTEGAEEGADRAVETPEDGGLFSIRLSDETKEKLSGPIDRARQTLRSEFTVAGDLPPEVMEREVKRSGRIRSEMKKADFINRDINQALKDAGIRGGFRDMSEEQLARVDRALKGDLEAVPEEVRPAIRRARDHIDQLSQRMIDEGMVKGKLAATVRENMGTYATRSYRIFDDPDWADNVPEKTKNRFIAWARDEIKKQNPQMELGENAEEVLTKRAEGLMNAILRDEYEGPLQTLASGKMGSKDLGILQRRKDIPEPWRELMGEYKDPRVNYVRSVNNMVTDLENQAFLEDVREAGMREGWLKEQPEGEVAAKIAADESSVMSPLNGLRTTPEIKKAFEENASQLDEVGGVTRWFLMKPIAVTKTGKTVFSPMTHVRNFESNILPQIASGHNPFKHWGKAGDVGSVEVPAIERMRKNLGGSTEQARAYTRELIELGVVDQSARAGEMRDVLEDAFGAASDMPTEATAGQLRKATEGVTKLYQSEDDFWKTVFYESELAKYREAMPEASEEELKQIAARNTRAMMPTYERVPKAVRRLRRIPFVASFPSFYAEVIRNSYNLLRQTTRELRHANPAIRKIGRKRAMGMLAAATVAPAVSAGSRFLVGYGLYKGGEAAAGALQGPEGEAQEEDPGRLRHAISATEDQDIRRFLPPWSKNSTIVYTGTDEEGNLGWVDLSYTDYYAGLRKPVTAALRGEDFMDSLGGAMKEMLAPFASEDIFVQKVLDLVRNKRATGGEVWNPSDDMTGKLEDALAHLWKGVEPGAISSAKRISKGLQGEVTDYGKEYDAGREALAVGTGVRFQSLDFKQALGFKARDSRTQIRDAQRILTSVASNRGRVPMEELREAYEEMEQSRRKAWEAAYKDARAAIRTGGLTENEVIQLLDHNGFSQRDAAMVVQGQYVPYQPSSSFYQSIATSLRDQEAGVEEMKNLRSRADLIQQMAAEQPNSMVWSEDGWVPAEQNEPQMERTGTGG